MNDTECVDSPRGKVETYITRDVPAYIETHYSVTKEAASWGIGGSSMGGMRATMLALRHPSTFGLFLDFSGASAPETGSDTITIDTLFRGSVANWTNHQPIAILKQHRFASKRAFFATGKEDNPVIQSQIRGRIQRGTCSSCRRDV